MNPSSNDQFNLNSFGMLGGGAHSGRADGHASASPSAGSNIGPQSYHDFTPQSFTNGPFEDLSGFNRQFDATQASTSKSHALGQTHRASTSNRSDRNSIASGRNGLTHSSPSEFGHPQAKLEGSAMEVAPGSTQDDDQDGQDVGELDDVDDADKRDEKGELLPAWSDMKTKAGKERKRLPLACIACRRKKIRCSGEKPSCKHCVRSRIPCVYKVTTRKAAPRTDYMAMLDKRLRRMEDRVIKLIPKENQNTVTSVGRAVLKPQIPAAPSKASTGNKKRQAEEAFDHGLKDWSKSKVQDPTEKMPLKVPESEESKLLSEGADSLPSKEIQEHLSEIYFEYVYGQSYPLLHKPSFMKKLAAGAVPPVLVLTVCAVSARFSAHPSLKTEPAFLRGADWAEKARDIALRRYDTPSVTILIVYLLLGLHEFGTCHGGRSWMLGGMAQRMAYALQLHRDLKYEPRLNANGEKELISFTDREIRRRAMWSCFLMDRFNSSGTERPLFVSEQYIIAQLPIKEQLFQMEIEAPTENLEGHQLEHDLGDLYEPKENLGVMAYLIRLVTIWGRLINYQNHGGREKDSFKMWDERSEFNAIMRSVEEWKSDLPLLLEWSGLNLETQATEKTANQYIYIHILHSQIILFMNRFALPNVTLAPLDPDMPKPFIQQAARAAVNAANKISIFINDGHFYNVTAPFAGYAAFFSSTVHIWGVFSKNEALENSSKKYLAFNVKYLSRMKKWWGMFHFVAENLKEMYRQHADAALRGPTPANREVLEKIFQYGDWFQKYPHGVSKTDYEDPAAELKGELGDDAVLSDKADLRTVEEFFASLSPPSRASAQEKTAKRPKSGKGSKADNTKATPESTATRRRAPSTASSQTKPQLQQPQQPQTKPQHPQLSHLNTMVDPSYYSQAPTSAAVQNYSAFPNDFSGISLHTPLSSTSSHPTQNPHNTPLTPYDVHLQSSLHQSQQHNQHSNPNQNWWPLDTSYMAQPGGYNLGDGTNSWFMPFNVEPPDIVNDDLMAQGGAFDFTAFAGTGIGPPGEGEWEAMGQHEEHPTGMGGK